MNVVFSLEPATQTDAAVLAYCVSENFESELSDLDARFDGHLIAHLTESGFKGKRGNKSVFPTFGKTAASHLHLLGVGDGTMVRYFSPQPTLDVRHEKKATPPLPSQHQTSHQRTSVP